MNKKAANVPMQYQRVGLNATIRPNKKSTDNKVTGAITLILNNVPNKNVM